MPRVSKPKRPVEETAVFQDVEQLAEIEQQSKVFTERTMALKARITQFMLKHVPPNENGHRKWTFPEPIGHFVGIDYVRKVSQRFDPEKAEAVLRKLKLYDQCITVPEPVPYLDEDKIVALAFDGKLSEQDLAKMYTNDESFAFTPRRQR